MVQLRSPEIRGGSAWIAAWAPPARWFRHLLTEADRKPTASSLLIRYGVALVFVVAALSLTLILQQFAVSRPTLFLFFAAIIGSTWFGGTGPGVVAVLLSLPAGLYFYSVSLGSFGSRVENALLLLLFALCAVAGGALGSWRRRAETALAQKALQLQAANDALRAEISERQRAEQALQEAQAELARASRLTAMGELAATIAHEINQPLAAISNSASACVRWLNADPPDLAEARLSASWIARDSARAAAVVSRVRTMVRNAMPAKASLDLNRTIEDVLGSLDYDLRKHRIAVTLALDPAGPRLFGDRVQLQQVFLNIFMNAIEAMAACRDRRLDVRSFSSGEHVRVEMEDSGGGFEGAAEALFQPFFTTKPAGMGLGLSICRSIVEAHGGELTAIAGARGARFCLAMPKAE